ncbi:MAG: DUF6057 family protein [Prevotella sp.]|nr:DUF6057 family protein [Prevotella sp.]
MRVLCALFFVVFTFFYLYFYQADVLSATQHLLSGGQTHYDRTIGAVLITTALFVLQLGVLAITKLTNRAHSITYFPSLLALTVLTDIQVFNDGSYSFGHWPWLSVVLLVLFGALVYYIRGYFAYETKNKPRYNPLRLLWTNLLTMCVMFLFVGFFSNHDDVFHYRMKMESCMLRRDYNAALEIGEKSEVRDSNLTMLRIQALARSRQLGERLFEYPVCGGSSVMMPDGKSLRSVFYPLHRFIRYPELDYKLCGYLLDKNLDAFARTIKANASLFGLEEFLPTDLKAKSVKTNKSKKSAKEETSESTDTVRKAESLPKHYREALVMYSRMRAVPVLNYHDDVADADYEDFLQIRRGEKDARRRSTILRDVYGNTYWYYFFTR